MKLDDLMLDRDGGIILPLVDFRPKQEPPPMPKEWLHDVDEDFICLPWKDE